MTAYGRIKPDWWDSATMLLRETFGDTVKLLAVEGMRWDYKLWFADDHPSPEVIAQAKHLVDRHCLTDWEDDPWSI